MSTARLEFAIFAPFLLLFSTGARQFPPPPQLPWQCNAMQCSGQIPLTHANRVLTAPHFQLWESWFSSAQLSFLSSILHHCFCSDHSGALVGWFEPLLMTRPSPIIPHLPPCHATLLHVMGALRVGLLYRVMALVQDSIYHDATDFCGRGGRKMDCLLLKRAIQSKWIIEHY